MIKLIFCRSESFEYWLGFNHETKWIQLRWETNWTYFFIRTIYFNRGESIDNSKKCYQQGCQISWFCQESPGFWTFLLIEILLISGTDFEDLLLISPDFQNIFVFSTSSTFSSENRCEWITKRLYCSLNTTPKECIKNFSRSHLS